MKPSLLFLLGLIFAILILGVATLHSSVLILSIPLMTSLFAAIFRRPEQITLAMTRVISPDSAPQGTPITVKLTVLKVRNDSGRSRRLSATGYVELVLG